MARKLRMEYTAPADQVRLKFGDILRDRKYPDTQLMVINQQTHGFDVIAMFLNEPVAGRTQQLDSFLLAGLDVVYQELSGDL